MSSIQNSAETMNAAAAVTATATVNAAATAIANVESRVQPREKSRWRGFWSHYWCFSSHKNGKRIGHAVRVPESTIPRNSASVTDISSQTASIVLPFIAPPSSPASFLQSDPPSATLSPARIHPVVETTASAYTIGPYAHESQLVSPPVFSEFTTEPSTASVTPHPEATTPSSPEVPFAELLSTSVARSRKTYEANLRFPLSQYDYQPYQSPGSPGSRIISTGYTVPNSGTSSPFANKPPKSISYDHFARKWGSRLGSGSLTPNGGWGSRLGSGTTTPYGDRYIPENEISEVASLANSDNESENKETIVDHRLSFELTGVPHHDKNEDETVVVPPSNESKSPSKEAENDSKNSIINTLKEVNTILEGEEKLCIEKRQSTSLGSSKDFNFDNTKQESLDRSMIDCEWWTNDNRVATEVVQYQLVTHERLLAQFTPKPTPDMGMASAHLETNRPGPERGQFRPQGNGGYHNNGRGRGKIRGGRGRGRGGRGPANQGTGRPTCQVCNKVGHTAIECYYRFNSNYSGHGQPSNYNISESHYLGQPSNYNSQPATSFDSFEYVSDDVGYVDSGATNRITSDLHSLQLSQSYDGNATLSVGNGEALPIRHTGHFPIPTHCTNLDVNNVLHVPHITKILSSVSQLTSDNHVLMEFHSHCCFVKDKNTWKVLLEGILRDGLYQMMLPQAPNQNSLHSKVTPSPRSLVSVCNKSVGHRHESLVSRVKS